MCLLILLLNLTIPSVIDGENTIVIDSGRKSGDAILIVNGETILRFGSGPNECIPHTMHYDWITKTMYVGSDFRGFWVKGTNPVFEKFNDPFKTLKGSWGDYRIFINHDYRRKKSDGGRITLERGEETILIAKLTARQAAMHGLIRLYSGRKGLVIIDNLARAIGYLPLRDGEAAVASMVTFPMPFEFRESPVRLQPNVENLFFNDALEITSGLHALAANNETIYLYDLSNTTGYFSGSLKSAGLLAGIKEGKLILSTEDEVSLVDPLSMATN